MLCRVRPSIGVTEMEHSLTQFARAGWTLHRARVRKGLGAPMPKNSSKRWLFLSADDPAGVAQIFPFFSYADKLRSSYGIELREARLQDFLVRAPYPREVEVVCFQTCHDRTEAELIDLVERLKAAYPGAMLIYLDWFAPTGLRYAAALHPHVEFYVKKHILRDRSAYGRPPLGGSKFTGDGTRQFIPPCEPAPRPVPESFLEKLVLGPNFACTPQMLQLLGRMPRQVNRPIDVHARIAVKGTPWYTAMRQDALHAVQTIRGLHVVCHGRISRRDYLRELSDSKVCFSPFGYGEVCWRDYEAVMCGALLLKPDMAHVQTRPDIFRPFETYVPVRWDLADLEEKIRYYIAHREERIAIAGRALAVIHEYVAGGGFLEQMDPLFRRGLRVCDTSTLPCYARTL